MISESHIEKALDYLRDTAEAAGEARAQAEHLDEMRHVILARIASKQNEKSEAAKDRLARSTQEYEDFLKGLKEARQRDYEFRNNRIAAQAKIEAWRSQQANYRAMKI